MIDKTQIGGGTGDNTIQRMLSGDNGTVSAESFLSAFQNVVVAINNLNDTMGDVFPQASSLSTTAATAGTITFTSSQAVAFMSVLSSSGGTYKIPLFA